MWDIAAAVLEPAKVEQWLAFGPSPAGEDPADADLGGYIEGWTRLDAGGRPFSYSIDGEKSNPGLLAAVRRGREKSSRF
jgi:hypothetical protein